MSTFDNGRTVHTTALSTDGTREELVIARHRGKDRICLRGATFTGVVYIRATPTIGYGEGYFTREGNTGHDLAKAPRYTFPASFVENIRRALGC